MLFLVPGYNGKPSPYFQKVHKDSVSDVRIPCSQNRRENSGWSRVRLGSFSLESTDPHPSARSRRTAWPEAKALPCSIFAGLCEVQSLAYRCRATLLSDGPAQEVIFSAVPSPYLGSPGAESKCRCRNPLANPGPLRTAHPLHSRHLPPANHWGSSTGSFSDAARRPASPPGFLPGRRATGPAKGVVARRHRQRQSEFPKGSRTGAALKSGSSASAPSHRRRLLEKSPGWGEAKRPGGRAENNSAGKPGAARFTRHTVRLRSDRDPTTPIHTLVWAARSPAGSHHAWAALGGCRGAPPPEPDPPTHVRSPSAGPRRPGAPAVSWLADPPRLISDTPRRTEKTAALHSAAAGTPGLRARPRDCSPCVPGAGPARTPSAQAR